MPSTPVNLPVVAIVPMKPVAQAKTRLGSHLTPAHRTELTLAMLAWVLGVLRDSSVVRTVVVGGDEPVKAVALAEGAHWDRDVHLDLNLAVTSAFRSVWAAGESAAYVPGDLPLLTVFDVEEALRTSHKGDRITICPAHDGGTNGLFVPPSMSIDTKLGPNSFTRHCHAANESGLELAVLHSRGFERDVDTIVDLRTCIDLGARCLDGIASVISECVQ